MRRSPAGTATLSLLLGALAGLAPVLRGTASEPGPGPARAANGDGTTISGRLSLDAGKGQRLQPAEVTQGVVYFLPSGGAPRPRPGNFTVRTFTQGFSPNVQVVPVGSTVGFANSDVIPHNVFSVTPGAAFDLGTYAPGETRSTQFNKPGLVAVNCNLHASMRANVLVLATPHFARPQPDGRFTLRDVPAGPGTLVFWHPRARAQSQAVTVPMQQPAQSRLVASLPPLDHAPLAPHPSGANPRN